MSWIEWRKTWLTAVKHYSGISIKRTHDKADTSIRRTVWRGTDCYALRSNYLRENLYKADISIKRTLFLHQWCPLYRDSTVTFKLFFLKKNATFLSFRRKKIFGRIQIFVHSNFTLFWRLCKRLEYYIDRSYFPDRYKV